MTDVTIVGAGPTGLMLAGELALAGIDAVVLERRVTPELVGTRARGFHSRTVEILDQRGLVDRFLAEGRAVPSLSFAGTALDVGALPSRHAYTLGLGQSNVERLLTEWVEELGLSIRRGFEVTGFTQDDDGVDVHLADGTSLRSSYLVGADGGRSLVRTTAGIDLVGAEATRSYLIGEVRVTEGTPTGMQLDEVGVHAMSPMGDGHTVGVVVTEPRLSTDTDPSLADLRDALTSSYGTDFGAHDATWVSRFTDATRQAAGYRRGRVLIAGDAAHVHPPTGGQGIGLGLQDAVNLGWKLAQVVRGISPAGLLDSYEAERHAATAAVLSNVMVQALLQRADPRTDALRATLAGLLAFDGPRTQLAGLLSGLDVRYDLGDGHPLLGRRMPDLDLSTTGGPRRVFELLHSARPVLLDLGGSGSHRTDPWEELASWAGRVQHVEARCDGPWRLPVVGEVSAPTAVLVRPDGHVAWVGDGSRDGVREALTTWFGAPPPAR